MEESGSENKNGSQKPLFEDKDLHVQTSGGSEGSANKETFAKRTPLNFEISDDVKKELNELYSKGIDINELLRNMLKQRKEKIKEEKEEIAENIQPTASHYIQVRIRKILKEEHGKKCSIATCSKPATTIHHTQRFSLSQTHDPMFLAPLCEDHHAIAHSIDLKYHEAREKAKR
jgi:hypothetical protein